MTGPAPRTEEAAAPKGRNGAAPAAPGFRPDQVERAVRDALAQHLMRSPYLPPSFAQSLAADVAAMPPPRGKNAVNRAKRASVETLAELNDEIELVSKALREDLVKRHELPFALAEEMIMHGREKALTSALGSGFPQDQIDALAADLAARDALTPTLLLRSLCLGELGFFEAAMAALSATTPERARALIYDDGANGFFQLYELAALPLGLYRAFRATMEVILQLSREAARNWQRDFTDEIIARLVKEDDQVCPEDIEHVLSQFSRRLREMTGSAEAPQSASA